jgi:hypothetical protein
VSTWLLVRLRDGAKRGFALHSALFAVGKNLARPSDNLQQAVLIIMFFGYLCV